jgi:hypothetical protein
LEFAKRIGEALQGLYPVLLSDATEEIQYGGLLGGLVRAGHRQFFLPRASGLMVFSTALLSRDHALFWVQAISWVHSLRL